MQTFLFYFFTLLLGFFPYYYDLSILELFYHLGLAFYFAVMSSSMYGIYIVHDIAVIDSALELNLPSKLFSYIFVSFLAGVAIIYHHFFVCFELIFIGFSWSMLLDFKNGRLVK